IALVGGTMLWFGLRSGTFGVANSGGLHFYNRVVSEQGLIDPAGEATQELLSRLGHTDLMGRGWWEILEEPGIDDLEFPEFVSLLGDVAKEGVRAQPTAFVTYVPVLAIRNLLGNPAGWTPVSAETPEVNAYLETPPVLPFGAAALRWRWTLERVQSAI